MSASQSAILTLAEQNIEIFKELIKNQPFDVTQRGIVQEKLSNLAYNISIAGKSYKIKTQFDLAVNDVVYVTFPQNDRSHGFLSEGKSESITLPPQTVNGIVSFGKIEKNEIAIFADESGNVKSSGFTVKASVPDDAKFTDTVYTHPTAHDTSIIIQDENNRFVSDLEKNNWNSKASNLAVSIESNGLMIKGDKVKLDNIEINANNYIHPPTHPADIIDLDTTHRFVSDAEKESWKLATVHSNKAHAPSNAEANIIETVMLNGTTLPLTSKTVDIKIPPSLPLTGGVVEGGLVIKDDLVVKKSQYNANFDTANSAYIKILTMTTTVGYPNSPLTFSISGRSTFERTDVSLKLTNRTDSKTNNIEFFGANTGVYGENLHAYKLAENGYTYEIWLKQTQAFDNFYITNMHYPGYMAVKFDGTRADGLPSTFFSHKAATLRVYNRSEVDALIGSLSKLYTATIGTTWAGATAPFTQEITINGIKGTDTPVVDVVLSNDTTTAVLQEKAWVCVSRITTSDNKIKVYCNKDKPATAIPIQLKVVG